MKRTLFVIVLIVVALAIGLGYVVDNAGVIIDDASDGGWLDRWEVPAWIARILDCLGGLSFMGVVVRRKDKYGALWVDEIVSPGRDVYCKFNRTPIGGAQYTLGSMARVGMHRHHSIIIFANIVFVGDMPMMECEMISSHRYDDNVFYIHVHDATSFFKELVVHAYHNHIELEDVVDAVLSSGYARTLPSMAGEDAYDASYVEHYPVDGVGVYNV